MKKVMLLYMILAFAMVGCKQTNVNDNKTVSMTEQIEENKDTAPEETESLNFTYKESENDKTGYVIDSYEGEAKIFEIPESYESKPVIEIGEQALAYAKMEKVILGENIVMTDSYSFFYCKNLKTIEFNKKIKIIGESTFLCTGLSGKLVIPDSVERIETCAFGKTNLEEIEFGKGVKFVGAQAFGENENLKKAVFNSADIEFEDENAFLGSPNVTIVAPKGSTAEQYAKDNNINFEER